MKNLKKILAILLTALIMLSTTTAWAGAIGADAAKTARYSSKNDIDSDDDFKISKIFKIGDGEFLSVDEVLSYANMDADEYNAYSFYQSADIYDEDYNLLGFGNEDYNVIDLIVVDGLKAEYDSEYDELSYYYVETQYFLLVVNTDNEDMGAVTGMSIDDATFKYKSEIEWLYPNVQISTPDARWIEYYVMDDYSQEPYVGNLGYVNTFSTGESHVTCYVIDANGNVFKDECTVTVKLTFWQWIIKYICFGWAWGF